MALICVMSGVFFVSNTVLSAQENAVSDKMVDELIDKHIEALGGEMALEAESVKCIGELKAFYDGRESEPSGEAIMYYKDGTFAFGLRRDEQGRHQSFWGYDKDTQWRLNRGSGEVEFVRFADVGWVKLIAFQSQQVLHWRDWDVKFTRLDDAIFDDVEVHQLKVEFADTRNVTHCFNKSNGLLIASRVVLGSNEYEALYEYTEVEGVQCVSKVNIRHPFNDRAVHYVYSFSKWDYDSPLEDAVLGRPDDE